ncbi:WD40-repeat-containing domain protein [Hysterangium stoloniferum]|nr:WD40-repeat-containing domain protein [Hysterangium stoloniferum]
MENEATFVAPEGVYSLTEEQKPPVIHAAVIPPPHGQAYARLSTVTVKFPVPAQKPQAFTSLLGGGKDKEKEKERDAKKDLKSDSGEKESLSSSGNSREEGEDDGPSAVIVKGAAFPPPSLFAPVPSFSGKKKGISRTTRNLKTTSSTFVTRLQSAEGLSKILQAKQGEVTFLFYNTMKSFIWSEPKAKLMDISCQDPLARITFSAYPTCHDVNHATATHERLDVVIGFSTGDLIWFDPISSRYARINKQGSICNSVCTSVRWVPKSPTLFIVSYTDGSIVIYDKEREDGTFTPQSPRSTENLGDYGAPGEWNPNEEMFVSMPPWHPADKTGKNPISHWKLSTMSVLDFVFSPDNRYVAAVSEDGCLRIIDTLSERLVDTFASYFGSLTCVAWSPDGRFILTGGQDDLITVISPWEQRVIARCQGHSSFVSSIGFDELRCDGRTYRFASVGEDNKLIFWDFSSGALHRPKLQVRLRHSLILSSTVSLVLRRRSETIDRSTLHLPHNDTNVIRYHPAPSRNDVAILQPVLIKHVEGDILSVISFLSSAVLTVTRSAHIKFWVRPLVIRPTSSKRGKAMP